MSAVVHGLKSHFVSQQLEENGCHTKVSCTVVARIKYYFFTFSDNRAFLR